MTVEYMQYENPRKGRGTTQYTHLSQSGITKNAKCTSETVAADTIIKIGLLPTLSIKYPRGPDSIAAVI